MGAWMAIAIFAGLFVLIVVFINFAISHSYVRVKPNGRRDRENEGLVYCIHADRNDFDKLLIKDKLPAYKGNWQI